MNPRVATAKIANHLRTLGIAVLILLAAIAFAARSAGASAVADQLKKAQDADDKPAIIELSRRIVAIAPNDSDTWDTLAQTQFESEDLDGLERTLDAWQKAFRRPPAAIEDFRAGLCFKRKDYQCAEQHWLAFIATKPPRADLATDYDNLAELCAAQARWADHAAYRTKAIAAQDTAARRVLRAVRFPAPAQVGRRLRRYGESEQNGCHRSTSEGVAPAIRAIAKIPAANQAARCADRKIAK